MGLLHQVVLNVRNLLMKFMYKTLQIIVDITLFHLELIVTPPTYAEVYLGMPTSYNLGLKVNF